MRYELTRDVYTPKAIDLTITAFAHLLPAHADHHDAYSVVTIMAHDDMMVAELMNHALALSAQQLLQQ